MRYLKEYENNTSTFAEIKQITIEMLQKKIMCKTTKYVYVVVFFLKDDHYTRFLLT